jgi:hypothetical protein
MNKDFSIIEAHIEKKSSLELMIFSHYCENTKMEHSAGLIIKTCHLAGLGGRKQAFCKDFW